MHGEPPMCVSLPRVTPPHASPGHARSGSGRTRTLCVALALVTLCAAAAAAQKQYTVRGMVLKVDAASRTFVVSHEKIDGFMDAMTMPFEVRDGRSLAGLVPGAMVEFALLVGREAAYAERIIVRR